MGMKLGFSLSHTLLEERKLRVFEKRGLGKIFLDLKCRKGSDAGEDCIMRIFIT
jgi:hypothetical protein